MPISLLTPIATDLHITEGQAGQGISVSGLFALFTSLLMAAVAMALLSFGSSTAITTVLLGLWGAVATAAPVGWWTWLARTLPNDAEAGGGLMVAIIQLAIASGAIVGGLVFDASGYRATFETSAGLLGVAAVLACLAGRAATRAAAGGPSVTTQRGAPAAR